MRIRNKNIPIRVTEKELEIIDRKAAKAKLSRTDFLVTAALGKEITLMEDLNCAGSETMSTNSQNLQTQVPFVWSDCRISPRHWARFMWH